MFDAIVRSLTLRRLEWVGVAVPIIYLALYNLLLVGPGHRLLHSPWGISLLILSLALVVIGFSRLIFRAVRRLQHRVEELSRLATSQNAQLHMLHEANLALSQEKLVLPVLQRVVGFSRELVQARYAALSVVDDEGVIKAFLTSGIDDADRQAIGELPSGKGLLKLMLSRTEPLRLDNIADHQASVGFPQKHPEMKTFLGTPIRYKGQVLGSLYLTEKLDGASFTVEDQEVVRLFAAQAAVAIQNTRLNEQIQALAVETERTRISREMHDGLAQVLAYVNTKAQAVEAYLAKGDVTVAQEQVKELSQAAREAYKDIREGILALRSQVGSDRSLHDVLEEYVLEFQHQLGRPVSIAWNVQPEQIELSSLQEVQILRIIQESLANVRKHADAKHIRVNFNMTDDKLEIEIKDDGNGFNPLAIKRGEWPHLGLQTMQERAEAIGGTFEIDSTPGTGTVVRVSVPVGVGVRAAEGAV